MPNSGTNTVAHRDTHTCSNTTNSGPNTVTPDALSNAAEAGAAHRVARPRGMLRDTGRGRVQQHTAYCGVQVHAL